MIFFQSKTILLIGIYISYSTAINWNLPDCSIQHNQSSAECICRHPKNWHNKICQGPKWFGKAEIKSNIDMRIINGVEVPTGTYPWFARPTFGSEWGECGGSLVSPEYVLTAAHCLVGNIKEFKSIGGYQIGALCTPYGPNASSNCGQYVESFGIKEVYMHPNYDDWTAANDYALVRMDGSSTVQPVDMDPGNISPGYENMSSKGNLWPVGFGQLQTGQDSDRLMHVNVDYVKQSVCDSAYSADGGVFDNMMCAAATNKDSCHGDSGGPLYDSDNNVVVGVVSWGLECASPQYPGVYARVSKEISWLEETICANHGSPKPSFCPGAPTPPTPTPPTPTPPSPTPPSPTPPSPTPPSCVDSPSDWHDSDGEFYNCEWYADDDNCSQFGDMFENNGYTANEACCVCGGGETGTPTPPTPSPPTTSPTQLLSSTPSMLEYCVDSELRFLVNGKGRTCSWVGATNTALRCAKGGGAVAGHCPLTCGTCNTDFCSDARKRFYLTNGNLKSCAWVANKDTANRCLKTGVSLTCRETCSQSLCTI